MAGRWCSLLMVFLVFALSATAARTEEPVIAPKPAPLSAATKTEEARKAKDKEQEDEYELQR
ncbi:MAG TPA: hypothetical protein VJL29_12875, partial [Thermoguttaceae bacterium]|nr:hypothetical protein [Thermoguttaceae bacterium]